MKWTETIPNPLRYDNPDPRWIEPSLPDFELIQSLAREVGYSVGIHGSLKRDVDLIAAPWTEDAVGNYTLIRHLCAGLNAKMSTGPEHKPHGRVAVTLQIDGYYKTIDLSIMPTKEDYNRFQNAVAVKIREIMSQREEILQAFIAKYGRYPKSLPTQYILYITTRKELP